MSDVIHLLSDAIANQIAAGEVIQRPSSVVKELVENAVDAGADTIEVLIKDAGRTLVQVVDNGKGMSETDARMAFERHATSKIRTANDLFALHTMGFRGEALASIAAVAQVEVKTRREEDPVGTLVRMAASQLESQESVATQRGTVFSIKNLFYNVPARRKFLKSNETEFRNIINEFERIALANPQIAFSLRHNDAEVFNLPATHLRQRVVSVMGKNFNQQLLSLNVETSLVSISGFVGTPAAARKRGAQQFFFVNNRFMKHAYFHKAIMLAFEPYIPSGEAPNYFIFLSVDPTTIDVNIHPTKTEIKFEHEQAVWQIIMAVVKEAIAKSSAIPTLEFDQEGALEIPVYNERTPAVEAPRPSFRSDYNPFKENVCSSYKRPTPNWESFFENKQPAEDVLPAEEEAKPVRGEINQENKLFNETAFHTIMPYKGKYLTLSLKSGLTLVNQHRASVRILFDDYMHRMQKRQGVSQGLLFPEIIYFSQQEAVVLPFLLDELSYMGFDLADLGNNSFSINGIPSGLENIDVVNTLREMLTKAIETGCEVEDEINEALALTLARKAAIPYGRILSDEEANRLLANLFAASNPTYTPDGKRIIANLTDEELDKKFK